MNSMPNPQPRRNSELSLGPEKNRGPGPVLKQNFRKALSDNGGNNSRRQVGGILEVGHGFPQKV